MVICTNVSIFKIFLSVFWATILRIANENQVWEKIIFDKFDFKILGSSHCEKYKKRELIVLQNHEKTHMK